MGSNPISASKLFLKNNTFKAIDVKEKKCKCCENVYLTSEFYEQQQTGANGQIWRYYDTLCKKCRSSKTSDRRRNLKLQAIEYKGGKCVDCGYNELHPEVYDFHHLVRNTKEFDIFISIKSWVKIKKELDKCVLLCANCHRIRHASS